MNAHYQKRILQACHEKRIANTLSLNLVHPTPAKLRTECIDVFKKRYKKKDEVILKMFFGSHDDDDAYAYAINKIDIDRFRPLVKLLKEDLTNTDEKNLELLAWLIDFHPRPYQWNHYYEKDFLAKKGDEVGEESDYKPKVELNGLAGNEEKHVNNYDAEEIELKKPVTGLVDVNVIPGNDKIKQGFQLSKRQLLVGLLVLVVLGGGGELIYWKRLSEKCMCWVGDKYEQVSCNEKKSDNPVYALDSLKVERFKKITKTDTLSANAIGRVWYSKIDGDVEFYTADGYHPVHTDRRLKPLTLYILNKYAHHH